MTEAETLQVSLDDAKFHVDKRENRILLSLEHGGAVVLRDVTDVILEMAATHLLAASGGHPVGKLLSDDETGEVIEVMARVRDDLLDGGGRTWQ